MKNPFRPLALLVYVSISVISEAQIINPVWVNTSGGTFLDFGYKTKVDIAQNVYLLGGFSETVDFDPSTSTNNITALCFNDMVLQKLTSSGSVIWTKTFGANNSNGHVEGLDIFINSSQEIFVTGRFTENVDFDPGVGIEERVSNGAYDIFILKLNSAGAFQWVKTIGSTGYDRSFALTVDNSDNVLITGSFSEVCDFDPGPAANNMISAGWDDVFVLKLTENGDFIWSKSIGGADGDFGYDISSDILDNIFLVGRYWSTSDFDPGAGQVLLSPVGISSGFILKLNANGNFAWANSYGLEARSIITNSDGSSYILGKYGYYTNFGDSPNDGLLSDDDESGFVQKIDANGNNLWVRSLDCDSILLLSEIMKDASENLYITGAYVGSADFDLSPTSEFMQSSSTNAGDGFLLKLTESSDLIWVNSFAGDGFSFCRSSASDANGNIYLTGEFYNEIDFGGSSGITNSQGENDMFLMKIGSIVSVNNLQNLTSPIKVYPNPSDGLFNLKIDNVIESKLTIYNNQGQSIESRQIKDLNTIIDLTNYPSGIYILHLSNNEGFITLKIAKQ